MKYFVGGSLFFCSFLIPANIYSLLFFDLSEIVLIISLIYNLSMSRYQLKTFFVKKVFINNIWTLVILSLGFIFIVSRFDLFIVRLIFFTFIGFSIYILLSGSDFYQKELFILPSIFLLIVNLIISIFQISLIDNSYGWILFNIENPNFFQAGRLSGLQGSGPNVAGAMFALLFIIYLAHYHKTKKIVYFISSLVSIFLVLVTYSRGSYLAIFLSTILFFVIKDFSFNKLAKYFFIILIPFVLFLYFGNSQIFLKESDRGYLNNIAVDNLKLISGLGGGNYVEEIYGNYLLSINPEILESSLNIVLNDVELGITPEEYRDSGINFFMGTSGSGYELLQNSFIVDECEYDRRTCQYQRIDNNILSKFTSILLKLDLAETSKLVEDSLCIDSSSFITRIEFACFIESNNVRILNQNINISEFIDIEDMEKQRQMSFIRSNYLFVECEDSNQYACPNREMSVGELAVIIENVTINRNILPIENFTSFCSECSFLSVDGFIKIIYDKYQGILPRSTIAFYTSSDGTNWDIVGSKRTTGEILNLNTNNGYIEVGGHSDGQSFGNTFLDANIKKLIIKDQNKIQEINFINEKLGEDYFVFKPNTFDSYTSKITFEQEGIKLFRPNKYWLAVDNSFDFQNDFEIIIEISFPELPWEKQTLISNTSRETNQHQSWRIDINDGRFFLRWADEDGAIKDSYVLGDKSLRSGILSQKNGILISKDSPIVDPSFLSQLTTAHNGYLTFSVEFGLIWSLFLFSIFIYIFRSIYLKIGKQNYQILIFLTLIIFLITNLTNDMLYSPDIYLLFVFCLALNYLPITDSDFKNS
tara:strand:- start:3305 stop:5755 length:2451 start_codon:yes stop_codon:yes gene_type:complete